MSRETGIAGPRGELGSPEENEGNVHYDDGEQRGAHAAWSLAGVLAAASSARMPSMVSL